MDDLTGQRLDSTLVKAARKLEMDYVKSKGLWLKKPTKECFERTGKPPGSVRWADTNKGDDKSPNTRSRLVARQIRGPGQAPGPSLEAFRTVLSLAATDLVGRARPCRLPNSEEGRHRPLMHRVLISTPRRILTIPHTLLCRPKTLTRATGFAGTCSGICTVRDGRWSTLRL